MASSNYEFNRWVSREHSSWALRVFKKHTKELLSMYTSFDVSKKFVYSMLRKNKANMADPVSQHFVFSNPWEYDNFSDLKSWSDSFNQLDNWINLNALVSLASTFETYIATIVPLALESDIGVLFRTSQKIDGIEILKHGKEKPFDFKAITTSCTKGAWSSRIAAYGKTFGSTPSYLASHIKELDEIQTLRNNIAHAFGRDIEESRNKFELTTKPIKKLTRKRFLMLQDIVWKSALCIDTHLKTSHIGEYQSLLFYHRLYPTLNASVHPSMRAIELKKEIGRYGDIAAGKKFCKGLVEYYESL